MEKSFSVVNVFPKSILEYSYAKGNCITLKKLPVGHLPQVAMLAKDQICLRLIPEFTSQNSDLRKLLQLDYSEVLLLTIVWKASSETVLLQEFLLPSQIFDIAVKIKFHV